MAEKTVKMQFFVIFQTMLIFFQMVHVGLVKKTFRTSVINHVMAMQKYKIIDFKTIHMIHNEG